MRIHWINSRGDDRSAESIAIFLHDGFLYHVAFCPDFRQPRIFKEVSVDTTALDEPFRWCETID